MRTGRLNTSAKIWRQSGPVDGGHFESYRIDSISDEASFLEMLDVLNEKLIAEGLEAVTFDHDCREGICGTCSLMIDGQAHGPQRGTATCQLHMRKFASGDTIVIEPWRATAFPIVKDLMVDRSPLDRIVRWSRVEAMVETMDEHFGSCTNHGECEAACPKSISLDFIALMHRDYRKAKFKNRKLLSQA